jgi:uncharacterized membrane protein YdbT with pleckstrin-like domain
MHILTTESAAVFNQVMGQFGPQRQSAPSFAFLYVLAFVPTIFSTLATLAVTLVAYLKSTVTLTNRRLTYRTGFVRIVAGELPLENVDAIFTEEPLLGRLFGFGTVVVASVGGLRLPFRYLRSPDSFCQILNKAMNKAKSSSPENEPEPIGKGQAVLQQKNDDSRYMPKM